MRFKPSREHYRREGMTEQADTESTAVAWLYTAANGKPAAHCFSAKRQKPDSSYYYQNEASRAAAIERHRDGVRRNEAYKRECQEQRKAVTAGRSALEFKGDYLSAADVAALCRQALKESFPGVRFSVTSDRCIRIAWTDGPAAYQVERIGNAFQGSYFDGMIDYKGSIDHTLDGRKVRFSCDFVTFSRTMTVEALQVGADAAAKHYETDKPAAVITAGKYGPDVEANPDFPAVLPGQWPGEFQMVPPADERGFTHSVRVDLALERWFDAARPVEVQQSATLARVAVLGSDGYGMSGLEPTDGGEGMRGYPRPKENPEAPAMREAIAQAERQTADLFASFKPETFAKPAAFDLKDEEPAARVVDCQVIDLMPHLAARADAARRLN